MHASVSPQRVWRPIITSSIMGGMVGLCASCIYLTSVLVLVLDANRRSEIMTYDSFAYACLLSILPVLLGAVSAGLISATIQQYASTSLRAARQIGTVIPTLIVVALASLIVLFGGLWALLFWALLLGIPAVIYIVLGRLGAWWCFRWMQLVDAPEPTPSFLALRGTRILIRSSMILFIVSLCYQYIRVL